MLKNTWRYKMDANTHYDYFSSRGGTESDSARLTSTISLAFFINHNYNLGVYNYSSSRQLKHIGFTLAEVLITLAIIGIVAALTIPTLVANYQNKAWNTSAQVFERKLEEALKTMNTMQTIAGHRNTAAFVNELGKYFKINKICNNDELLTCFEDKVIWGSGDAEPTEIDMTNIKMASNFGQENWGTEIIGAQFANGTVGLIAYNPDCTGQPYSNQFDGSSCLAILYDTNGFKAPNTKDKDLRNNANVLKLGNVCAFEIGGACFGQPFDPVPISKEVCLKKQNELGISNCSSNSDYWAGAALTCGGVQNMATTNELKLVMDYIYPNGKYDPQIAESLGFNPSFVAANGQLFFRVWTNQESSGSLAYIMDFDPTNNRSYLTYRYGNVAQALCVIR